MVRVLRFELKADIHIAAQKEEAKRYIENLKQEAIREKNQTLAAIEGEVVDLVVHLLDHIIGNELSSSNKWVKCLVNKLLHNENIIKDAEIGLSSRVYASMTPVDIAEIEGLIKNVSIIERPDLQDYTCVILTDNGEICYDVNETLENVKKDLRLLEKLGDNND